MNCFRCSQVSHYSSAEVILQSCDPAGHTLSRFKRTLTPLLSFAPLAPLGLPLAQPRRSTEKRMRPCEPSTTSLIIAHNDCVLHVSFASFRRIRLACVTSCVVPCMLFLSSLAPCLRTFSK